MEIVPMSAETIQDASTTADAIFAHDNDEFPPSKWFAASLTPGGADDMRRAGEDVGHELAHWVAIDDGKVLGSTGLYTRPQDEHEGVTWLSWHCVSPDARGKRVGSSLLDFAIGEARKQSKRVLRLYTWTHPTENEAQKLYESRDLSLFRVERQRDGWEKMYRQLVLSPQSISYSEEESPSAGSPIDPEFGGVRFFGLMHNTPSFEAPKERTIMAMLTSFRRRARECVGQQWPTNAGILKVEGVVDRMLANVRTGYLRQFVELSSLMVDDIEEDVRHVDYPLKYSKGKPWIHHPSHRYNHKYGVQMSRAPASYRRTAGDERAEAGTSFANGILGRMRSGGADVLLCDDLDDQAMNYLAHDPRMQGRLLHVQPYSSVQGMGDAYMRAIRGAHGYVLDSDTGRTVPALAENRMGFRLSLVLPEGNVPLCEALCTPVYSSDDRIVLGHRNYHHSLRPVLLGLQHYVRNIQPLLWHADPRTFREVSVNIDTLPWREAV